MTLCESCKINVAIQDTTQCLMCTELENPKHDYSNGSHADSGKGLSEAQVIDVTYIRSELLCYAIQYAESSSPDRLIGVLCSSFSVNEIKEARDLLWKSFASHLDKNPRRSGRKGTGTMNAETEAEDIVKFGVVPLANKKVFDRSSVQFCAVDLHKIPKYNPEETNVHSMITNISELQGKIRTMEKIVNQNTCRIEELHCSSRSHPAASAMSHAPSSTSSAFPPLVTQSISSWKNSTFPSVSEAPTVVPAKSTPYLPQHPELMVYTKPHNRSQNLTPTRPTNGYGSSDGQASNRNDKWQQVRRQRKNAIQEKAKLVNTIVGKRNATSLTGAVTTKTIFISNVDRNWSDGDITNEMKSHKVDPVLVKCVSHKEAHTKSFKVVIREDDQGTVICPEFWPERVRCREWIQVTSNST